MSLPPAPEVPSLSHPATTRAILRLLETENLAGKHIRDLGAGPGYLSWKLDEFLAQRGIDGRAVITACDLFPEQFKYDRLTCEFGDLSDRLQYADATFDIVLCMEVIEHVPDQKHLISEIARILKPGGRAIVTTANTLNVNARLQYIFTGTMPLFDIMPVSAADVVHTSGHINPISAYYLFYFAKLQASTPFDFASTATKDPEFFGERCFGRSSRSRLPLATPSVRARRRGTRTVRLLPP